MAKNWRYASGILWPHLVSAATNNRTLFYSDLAPHVATNPRSVDKALGPIFNYCIDERLPRLTSIVINKQTGKPGPGLIRFIRSEGMSISRAQRSVYEHNWNEVDNPFGGFGENDTIESFSTSILNDPSKAKTIYSRVKVRGPIQAIFRAALLDAYDRQCAVCGLSFEEVLEAAHIVPWRYASDEQRISPRNGVLLCANHHRLFDSGQILIAENRKVYHDNESLDDYGDCDRTSTVDFHEKRLCLTTSRKVWPAKKVLAQEMSVGCGRMNPRHLGHDLHRVTSFRTESVLGVYWENATLLFRC